MATVAQTVPVRARSFFRNLRAGDQIAYLITFLFAASVVLVTTVLVFELWQKSELSIQRFGFAFLRTTTWDPVNDEFGALPFIYGTIVTSVLGLAISVPLGVGAAIFLSELAPPKTSNTLTFLVELLAAVPSVIFGLLAIFALVPLMRLYVQPALIKAFGWSPFFKGPTYGVGVLTASIVLAVMMFPYIISISREALIQVPREQREAALALGATRWEATWDAVVPFARLGIVGSIFLSLARALGETMAVTMVIGNDPRISASILAPGYTIASVIANEFTEATGDMHLSALVELGLVLFLITIILNGLGQLLLIVTAKPGTAR
ncbi:MAG TPA: phosphate ABC transporter permease subunit PstC [Bryobacteraceae bacterium]|nr:phosphate ABC transporter permease subunit PstC [Bryobacteraceae bacterium]